MCYIRASLSVTVAFVECFLNNVVFKNKSDHLKSADCQTKGTTFTQSRLLIEQSKQVLVKKALLSNWIVHTHRGCLSHTSVWSSSCRSIDVDAVWHLLRHVQRQV